LHVFIPAVQRTPAPPRNFHVVKDFALRFIAPRDDGRGLAVSRTIKLAP